jgi:hypothetical protein
MRRYQVEMTISVIVRADTEEEAEAKALENVHDSSIRAISVAEYNDHQCLTKQTPALKSFARS